MDGREHELLDRHHERERDDDAGDDRDERSNRAAPKLLEVVEERHPAEEGRVVGRRLVPRREGGAHGAILRRTVSGGTRCVRQPAGHAFSGAEPVILVV